MLGIARKKNLRRNAAKIGAALAVVAAVVPTSMIGRGTADSVSYPSYDATGTVVSTSPTQTSFTLQVSSSSPDLSSYETNGQLTISTGDTTNYYYTSQSGGTYLRSNYQQTVVSGASVEVAGHYVQDSFGVMQFSATYIWNPPQPTTTTSSGGSPGTVPKCGSATGLQVGKPFLVAAVVTYNRTDLPCFTNGNYPTGFKVDNPTYESSGMDSAFAAYGGVLEIDTDAFTKYAYGAYGSTWGQVVEPGTTVYVWGTYYYYLGEWTLLAKLVWAQPPPPSTSTQPITETANVVGSQSPPGTGNYTGVVSGSGFSGDTYTGSWNCAADPDTTGDPGGTVVTGTWKLSNGNNTVSGTMSGTIDASGKMDIGMTISNGMGAYTNAQGGGSMTGTATPAPAGTCPSGFNSTVSLTYVFVTG